MSHCSICGEEIPDGSRTCSMCGTSVDDHLPMGNMVPESAPAVLLMPAELPPGGRYCPVCIRVYGPDYADSFCSCGTELLRELPAEAAVDDVPMAPILLDELPMPVIDEVPAATFL